jgi:hypothetical protein
MSVTVVLQQDVVPEVGDVQIGVAVVVEVARCDAHAVAVNAGAAALGHVFERAVAAVAIEAVPAAGRLIEEVSALHQIQIEEAVIVHVEQRGAAAHDLREVVSTFVAGMVDEVDAGARADFFEPRLGGLHDLRIRSASTTREAAERHQQADACDGSANRSSCGLRFIAYHERRGSPGSVH